MVVIGFVVTVDYILGVTEHLLADNPIYDKIFRILYKELMMMGLITFIVIMLEALYEGASHEFYVSIDFAHILVFFQTIFFAFFAVLLIRMSFVFAKKYRRYAKFPTEELLFQYRQWSATWFGRFLLSRRYIPILNVVRTAEYRILETLFFSHYYVPENFDFASYVSGCFTRFALKAVNRSLITWLVLAILFVLNFARLATKMSCEREYSAESGSGEHRMLDIAEETEWSLAGSAVATHDDHHSFDSLHSCRVDSIRYFLVGGLALMIYTIILLFVSRIYKLRLLHFAGVRHALDYKEFLEYTEQLPEDEKKMYNKSYRLDAEELRTVLRSNMEAFEDEEDEEGFKYIATLLVKSASKLNRKLNTWSVKSRVFFIGLFCPHKLRKISEEERFMVKGDDQDMTGVYMTSSPGKPAFTTTAPSSPNKPSNGTRLPGEGSILDKTGPTNASLPMQYSQDLHSKAYPSSPGGSLHGPGHTTRSRIQERLASMMPTHSAFSVDLLHPHAHQHGHHHALHHGSSKHGHDHHRHHASAAHHADDSLETESAKERFMDILAVRRAVVATALRHREQQREATKSLQLPTDSARLAANHSSEVVGPVSQSGQDQRRSLLQELGSSMFSISAMNNSTSQQPPINEVEGNVGRKHHTRAQKMKILHPKDIKRAGSGNTSPASKPSNPVLPRTIQDQSPRHEGLHSEGGEQEDESEDNVRLSSYCLLGFHRFQEARRRYEAALPAIQAGHRSNIVHSSSKVFVPSEAPPGLSEEEKHALVLASAEEIFLEADTSSSSSSSSSSPLHAKEFHSLYFLHSPALYFHMVEFCIMFTCLYMAVWVTNMITVTAIAGLPGYWEVLTQLGLCIPFFFVFIAASYISETCSLLEAMTEPNPHVLLKVLDDATDCEQVVKRVQRSMLASIARRVREEMSDEEIVHRIFLELDQDGSGAVDYAEIEQMLSKLDIKLDFRHFRLLMRELQTYDPNGLITETALCQFLFPQQSMSASEQHVQRLKKEMLVHQQAAATLQQEIHSAERAIHARKLSQMMSATDSLNRSTTYDDV